MILMITNFLNIALGEVDEDFKCLHFPDCEKAMSHFSKQGVDAPAYVFIDLNLPRLNGGECLHQLQKKMHEFDHPCLVVYSTSVSPEWHERLERIGVDIFVEKSASISELRGKLTDIIK